MCPTCGGDRRYVLVHAQGTSEWTSIHARYGGQGHQSESLSDPLSWNDRLVLFTTTRPSALAHSCEDDAGQVSKEGEQGDSSESIVDRGMSLERRGSSGQKVALVAVSDPEGRNVRTENPPDTLHLTRQVVNLPDLRLHTSANINKHIHTHICLHIHMFTKTHTRTRARTHTSFFLSTHFHTTHLWRYLPRKPDAYKHGDLVA